MSGQVERIGKYRILGVLGKGAMGLVYRAEDTFLGREVALKVITGEEVTDEMKARFTIEARAAAALDHPNIVVVHDLGEENGVPYIAMELLRGEDLRQLLRRRPDLGVREAAEIVAQACDGLAYAHERRIVHRDIKPANIHVCPDGRIKIVDFGVAKMESTSLTKTGMVIGTPDYMSPEQIQGRPVDQRSDIFSVGVVFYEILTRRKPFRADSITSVIYNIVFKEPESFGDLRLEVAPAIERIVARAMAKEAANRYQEIGEMAADLRRFLDSGAASAQPAGSHDATVALGADEIGAATRPGAPAFSGTVQVGESPTQRRRAAEAVMPVPQAPARGRSRAASLAPWLAAGALVVVAAAAALLLHRDEAPPAPSTEPATAAAALVPVQVLVSPWAHIDRLERTDAVPPVSVDVGDEVTPVRLELRPGSYRMHVSNPLLELQGVVDFEVRPPAASVKHVLAGFDPAAAFAAGGP